MKAKLILEIRGGVLQSIRTSEEVEILLVDWDNNPDGKCEEFFPTVELIEKINALISEINMEK